MPHAAHFLERLDRITREQTDFALSLYRDDEALRYVLSRAKLPPGAERVALAIDGASGPFVIVTREGKFVTCLATGMSPGSHPVVPRAQIDAYLAKLADLRARRGTAERVARPREGNRALTLRLLDRGMRLARDEFVALSAMLPLYGNALFALLLETGPRAALDRLMFAKQERAGGPDVKVLDALHRLEWSVAHLMLLATMGERDRLDAIVERVLPQSLSATYPCTAQGGLTFLMRSVWASARLGRAALPAYRAALAHAQEIVGVMDAVYGIAGIGLRHEGAAADARRALAAYAGDPDDDDDSVDAMRAAVSAEVIEVLDDPDRFAEAAMKVGRVIAKSGTENFPIGDPYRFEREEDVPDDLARTSMLAADYSLFVDPGPRMALAALSLAARAAAEDFYFPREAMHVMFGDWTPQETLERAHRFRTALASEPVRREARPGRNDPCPCGSGRKFKKCHGGARP